MTFVCPNIEDGNCGSQQYVDCSPVSAVPSVSLHDLCRNCVRFTEQWEVLPWLQQACSHPPPTWPYYLLCPVSQLTTGRKTCHMCSFMLASVKRSRKIHEDTFERWNIYLQPCSNAERAYHIVAKIAKEPPSESTSSHIVGIFSFGRYTYSDEGAFSKHITAQTIPLGARDNLKRAKEWIQTCQSEHESCHVFHAHTVKNNYQRPTRVLEVTPDSTRLRCNMSKRRFDYLALSHMWGTNPTQQLQLTMSNLASLQANIPYDQLSRIYKEAIHATITLGYKYIWIDSLCIIQDSKPDWTFEARRMAIVYGNAVCNLAFLFPSTSSPTLSSAPTEVSRNDPRVWSPCILRRATPTHEGIFIQHPADAWRREHNQLEKAQDWLVQRKWPLFGRAWTFQEYLLAPRTLLLGHKNLMWQCTELFYDELLGPLAQSSFAASDTKSTPAPKRGRDLGKSRYFPDSISSLSSKITSFSDAAALDFTKDWTNLILEYRSRNLTKPTDRIVAFSGIARAVSNLGSLTYLAGLWCEILPLCLLWCIERKLPVTIREAAGLARGSDVEYTSEIIEHSISQFEVKVPSWSWFSIPRYKCYDIAFLLNNDEIYLKSKAQEPMPRVAFNDVFWASTYSFHFPNEGENVFPDSGFDDFSDLQISLELPILPVRINWPDQIAASMDRIQNRNAEDAHLQWIPEFEYFPDEPEKAAKGPPRNGVLGMLAEFQICRLGGKYSVQRRYAGLVLVPGATEDTWKREGVWKLNVKVWDVDVDEGSLGGVAERWMGYEVAGEQWELGLVTIV